MNSEQFGNYVRDVLDKGIGCGRFGVNLGVLPVKKICGQGGQGMAVEVPLVVKIMYDWKDAMREKAFLDYVRHPRYVVEKICEGKTTDGG